VRVAGELRHSLHADSSCRHDDEDIDNRDYAEADQLHEGSQRIGSAGAIPEDSLLEEAGVLEQMEHHLRDDSRGPGLGASIVRVGARVPVVALAHLPRLVYADELGPDACASSLPLPTAGCTPPTAGPLAAADPNDCRRNAATRPARAPRAGRQRPGPPPQTAERDAPDSRLTPPTCQRANPREKYGELPWLIMNFAFVRELPLWHP
jgi:hypothetical protein